MPTHAVKRREGSGLCAPHWTRKPRRGRAKAAVGNSSPALPTRDRRGSLFRSASTRPDQSQVRARGPGWPEQTLEASTSPQQVRQPAQQGTRRRARTYLVGGVSGTDRPPRSGGAAETSPRALRAQAAASSVGAAQLRHPDPAGDFHLLPGARGIAQRKWPGRTAVRFLLVPLSLTAREEESGAQRPRNPGSPPSGPCGALARPRTRAGGVGRAATAISA